MSKHQLKSESSINKLVIALLIVICAGVISLTLHQQTKKISDQELAHRKLDRQLSKTLYAVKTQSAQLSSSLNTHSQIIQNGINRLEKKIAVLESENIKLQNKLARDIPKRLVIKDNSASVGITPSSSTSSQETSFGGIGIIFQVVHDGFRIEKVLDPSPAQKAGLYAGDVVTEIEGKPISNMPKETAINSLRGTEGSEVKITVRPAGTLNINKEYELTREIINISKRKAD